MSVIGDPHVTCNFLEIVVGETTKTIYFKSLCCMPLSLVNPYVSYQFQEMSMSHVTTILIFLVCHSGPIFGLSLSLSPEKRMCCCVNFSCPLYTE